MNLPKEKTKPKQFLSDYTILLYGQPKIGKSTFASQFDQALFLDTEHGLNSLETYHVVINDWIDMLEACKQVSEGKHTFKTIIIDTIDSAIRLASEYVCDKYSTDKRRIDHESDIGSMGKGFHLVSDEIMRVLRKLSGLPYGLILISHAKTSHIIAQGKEYDKITPTLSDSIRKQVLGFVDIILYADIHFDQEAKAYKRILRSKPSNDYEAGDRTGRLPEYINMDFNEFVKEFNGKPPITKGEKQDVKQ